MIEDFLYILEKKNDRTEGVSAQNPEEQINKITKSPNKITLKNFNKSPLP